MGRIADDEPSIGNQRCQIGPWNRRKRNGAFQRRDKYQGAGEQGHRCTVTSLLGRAKFTRPARLSGDEKIGPSARHQLARQLTARCMYEPQPPARLQRATIGD